MDGRQQRGLEIAATRLLKRKGDLWIIPSQSGKGTYVVDPTERRGSTCSGPDYELRALPCKHVYAVELTMRRETIAPDGTVMAEQLRLTYRQEWTAHKRAQTTEKEKVATLLHGLRPWTTRRRSAVGRACRARTVSSARR